MIIAFDASDIRENKAGIGYYSYELLRALIAKNENSFILFTHNAEFLSEFKSFENVKIIEIKAESPNLKWILKVSWQARKFKYDYFISPSYFTFGVLIKNTVQIIHDLAPINHPEFWNRLSVFKFKLFLWFATFFTAKFAANSQSTLADLQKNFPRTKSKSFYIGAGLNKWTNQIATKDLPEETRYKVVKRLNLPEKYILSISTLQPRKNYVRAIGAFAKVSGENPELYYVIGGKKGWYFDSIFEEVKKLNIEDKVKFLGYVEEKDFPVLYDNALALVYVSIDEGAGLPPLEAYSRGLPVVLSDIPVHREIMQNNAIFVDKYSVESIAEGIKKSITQQKTKTDVKFLEIYDWNKVADRLIFELRFK